MPQAAEPGFPIDVDLLHNGVQHFETLAELSAWVTTETNFWQQFNLANLCPADYANYYKVPLEELATYINRYKAADNDAVKATLASRAEHSLHQLSSRFYLRSTRPEAVFLSDLRAANPSIAAGAWAHFVSASAGNVNIDPLSMASGVVRASLYEMGISDTAETARKTLDEVIATGNQQVAALADTQRKHTELGEGLHKRFASDTTKLIEDQTSRWNDDIDSFLKGTQNTFGALNGEYRKKLEEHAALLVTYNEELALKAPVEYWAARRLKHRNRTLGFAVGSAVLVALGCGAFWKLASALVEVTKPPVSKLVFYGLLLTMFLWAVRILARLLMANASLELDAGERAVMAQTYLALLREQGVRDTDAGVRALVLAALFRHSPTGLIRDDAGPNTPIDMLSRIVAGGR